MKNETEDELAFYIMFFATAYFCGHILFALIKKHHGI